MTGQRSNQLNYVTNRVFERNFAGTTRVAAAPAKLQHKQEENACTLPNNLSIGCGRAQRRLCCQRLTEARAN